MTLDARFLLPGFFLALWPAVALAQTPPFGPGEKIEYAIKFGGLAGGSAYQTVEGTETLAGRTAYRLSSEARSNKSFDIFHKVRERRDSWMDVATLASLKLVEDVREGSYEKQSESTVDPAAGRLVHTYKTKKHRGRTEVAVPPLAQDPLSIVYHLRTLPLTVGQELDIPLFSGDDVQTVKIKVKGAEKVRVPAGHYECLHLEPVLKDDGEKTIQIEVWLTTDARRIPVMIRTRLAFGSFTARMKSFTAGSAPPTP